MIKVKTKTCDYMFTYESNTTHFEFHLIITAKSIKQALRKFYKFVYIKKITITKIEIL